VIVEMKFISLLQTADMIAMIQMVNIGSKNQLKSQFNKPGIKELNQKASMVKRKIIKKQLENLQILY
jgi:hypothetical protein